MSREKFLPSPWGRRGCCGLHPAPSPSHKRGAYDGWSIRLDGSNHGVLQQGGGLHDVRANRRIMALVLPAPESLVIGAAPWPVTSTTATTVTRLSIGGGTMFPSYWSRDGRWLSVGLFSRQARCGATRFTR